MSKPSTSVLRRVFEEEGSYFLEVSAEPNSLGGLIEIRTVPGEESEGFWGITHLEMPHDFAEELGRALIDAAADIRSKQ